MMEKTITAADERRLTSAIEKAATLAAGDDSRDRSRLLASCLLENGVDSRFSKVASAAFNKRLTVLMFQKTADEHKADSFKLADADAVHAGMGGGIDTEQHKTAGVKQGQFSIDLGDAPAVMKKTASAPVHINYENRVTPELFERHAESMLQKYAAAHSTLMGMLHSFENEVKQQREVLKRRLDKCAAFELGVLCQVHGDKLQAFVSEELPDKPFLKVAAALDPETELSAFTKKTLDKMAALVGLNDAIVDYQHGLAEFLQGAVDYSKELHKTAAVAGPLIRSLVAATGTGIQAAEAVRKATTDAAKAGFSNAAAMSTAGTDNGIAPGAVLDSEFLIKDRFRDRLMGWSEMSADPLFSMYPSEQVFLATQKAMDMDPALERPDKRELLRANVGQLLAQNGRASTADIAATATTLKALSGAPRGAVQAAADVVEALEKKQAPEKPELKSLLPEAQTTGTPKDYFALAAAANAKEQEEADKREASTREAEAKEREKETERAERLAKETRDNEQKRIDRLNAARRAALSDIIRSEQLWWDPHAGAFRSGAAGVSGSLWTPEELQRAVDTAVNAVTVS